MHAELVRMIVELGPDEMHLTRWAHRLIEDMEDAGIIDNPDEDCTIKLDGRSLLLTVTIKHQHTEELEDIMTNEFIELVKYDLNEMTWRLDL